MENKNLLKTPLHAAHVKLGARMVPFAGYDMPVQYTGLLDETKNVRASAGLFDVSHMGQFSVRGKNSLMQVQKLVTNDLSKLSLGQAQYNMLCNPEGGVIDDLIVYRRSEDQTYICVNASNRKADFAWMKPHLTSPLSFVDESDDTALIAIQGPKAESILCEAGDATIARGLKYYWAAEWKIFGTACYLSRTGYTGEDGFEIYLPNAHAEKVWTGLLELGKNQGIVPAGLGARDTLRLEMGYPLHGHELSPTISPLQANLGWVVKLQLPTEYIGQKALQKEAAEGPKKLLKGLKVNDRRIPREGYKILDSSGKPVGTITSGTHSPHLNAPIAMGFVDKAAASGTQFFIEVREAKVPCEAVKLPFVPSHAKKG
jgi:aminomethyltransferase